MNVVGAPGDWFLPGLVAKGILLGWSIAWPPGPINAEMIRRGISRGFWPAWAVGLGACSGDFLWALAVAAGAGALADLPGVRPLLGATSIVLLLVLARTFFRGAREAHRAAKEGIPLPVRPLDSTRGGFVLGLGMALSSPWNIAFWLAVTGQQATGGAMTLPQSLLLAASVVIGASLWGLVLCTAVRSGARFATPAWEVGTQAATGLLMLVFAAITAVRLASTVG